jgi:hypothetical protein
MSSVALVAPQIFHVAFDVVSRSLSHAFCSRPSTVKGGSSFLKLGTALSPTMIAAGGLPPA